MKESDDLDHVVVCHTINHDMAWAFDPPMRVFALLAGIDEVIAAKARSELIAVLAANAIRHVGKRSQSREDQRLVAPACLIAELRLGEPEDCRQCRRAPRWKSDTAACSVFLACGEGCLQAQTLEVMLQIPFIQLSKAPVLKLHDAD